MPTIKILIGMPLLVRRKNNKEAFNMKGTQTSALFLSHNI